MRAALALVVSVLASSVVGQCLRPAPPPGGHPTNVDLLVPVTYSDAYQTFGSMILPVGAPPTCGWPLVVFVHPLGGTRGFDLGLQLEVAAQGYAVWSYDVRGHGQAVLSNLGHPHEGSTLFGPIERYDLAEQITFVGGNPTWTGIVDATRVAVVGFSQGGAHAWQAAAWSGLSVQAPDRAGTTFPTIACVVAASILADPVDDWLRGGRQFSSWFVEAISGSYTGTPFDPALIQQCRSAFLAQDPAALVAAFATEQRGVGDLLTTSTVPVLYSHAYYDNVAGPLAAIARGEARTAPHRVLIGTLGHGVPGNLLERSLYEAMVVRWLHRWLWNVPNEVDVEPPAVMAEVPLTQLERDDLAHRWGHVLDTTLATPPTATRLYLHDDAELRDVPPAVPQTDAVIAQVVDPLAADFTAADYLADPLLRDVTAVLQRCPLQERVWTRVVADESRLVRSPTLHVRVVPNGPHWQLAALLSVEAPGTGEEVTLGATAFASTTSVAGVAEDHDVRLPPVAVGLPAGSIVRLRLRNLWVRAWPMLATLETAPIFHDFEVAVVHGAAPDGSWLDLPLEGLRPRLVVDRAVLDLAAPAPLVATIRGGALRGGYPYFAMVGLSGHSPSVQYLNDIVPIDPDWLVMMSAGSSEPQLFTGFLGFLDSAGNAGATFDLSAVAPLPPVLNGLSFTLAAFVWDGPWALTGAATSPCDVLLR